MSNRASELLEMLCIILIEGKKEASQHNGAHRTRTHHYKKKKKTKIYICVRDATVWQPSPTVGDRSAMLQVFVMHACL
jgi:hypothetical protein